LGPVSGIKRKSDFGAVGAAFDPTETWAPKFAAMQRLAAFRNMI
jgi:hypothetical protein